MKGGTLHSNLLLALGLLTRVNAACTRTTTVSSTVTISKTTSSVLPRTTVTFYSSTVLIATPYSGPNPYSYPTPPNPVHCHYSTPPAANVQARDPAAATCTTITVTETISYICRETDFIYPPPIPTHKKGTLTTQVPSFCTNQPVHPGGNGVGNSIFPLMYPYFAQTTVECCIYCSEQYYDLVASAFIKSGLDCQCLVDTDGDHPGKSDFCPNGLEPYHLGSRPGDTLPGPCRKPRAS